MAASPHDLLQIFRRFVALRSAWRRSLALEPPPAPRPAADGHDTGSCCPRGCGA